jgi:hypothetical protein
VLVGLFVFIGVAIVEGLYWLREGTFAWYSLSDAVAWAGWGIIEPMASDMVGLNRIVDWFTQSLWFGFIPAAIGGWGWFYLEKDTY